MAIERLSGALRNSARLDKSDARMMHIMNDDPVLKLTRYNIRTPEGKIVKLTVGEDILYADYLKKNTHGAYLSDMKYILKSSSERISEKFADIIKNIIKK